MLFCAWYALFFIHSVSRSFGIRLAIFLFHTFTHLRRRRQNFEHARRAVCDFFLFFSPFASPISNHNLFMAFHSSESVYSVMHESCFFFSFRSMLLSSFHSILIVAVCVVDIIVPVRHTAQLDCTCVHSMQFPFFL